MHQAEILWNCDGDFRAGRYSRAHLWRFDGGVEVPASASPGVVPRPYAVDAAVDPEEAYIASISACHMLWFLDLARRDGHAVAAYHDSATGALDEAHGRMWIPRVDLNIRVTWDHPAPSAEAHRALHDAAHHACFIANSVKTEIIVHLEEAPA